MQPWWIQTFAGWLLRNVVCTRCEQQHGFDAKHIGVFAAKSPQLIESWQISMKSNDLQAATFVVVLCNVAS